VEFAFASERRGLSQTPTNGPQRGQVSYQRQGGRPMATMSEGEFPIQPWLV